MRDEEREREERRERERFRVLNSMCVWAKRAQYSTYKILSNKNTKINGIDSEWVEGWRRGRRRRAKRRETEWATKSHERDAFYSTSMYDEVHRMPCAGTGHTVHDKVSVAAASERERERERDRKRPTLLIANFKCQMPEYNRKCSARFFAFLWLLLLLNEKPVKRQRSPFILRLCVFVLCTFVRSVTTCHDRHAIARALTFPSFVFQNAEAEKKRLWIRVPGSEHFPWWLWRRSSRRWMACAFG